ncbi:MAG: beta-glucosidase BglX [Pseudomonadota bacterium]
MTILTTTLSSSAKRENEPRDRDIDAIVKALTLKQKIGQLSQRNFESVKSINDIPADLKTAIRNGEVSSLLNVNSVEIINELQRIATEESPQHIPLLIARDVIHGFKTIFPIPLGQAASWNPALVERGARVAAVEASSTGVRWNFAPMLDISRDPRWGRIAESFGEDPYLAGLFGAASVRGYQGNNLSEPTSVAACLKHFLGYGAAEGGRDYNTTNIPEPLLHNVYLRPFIEAFNAGSASVMTAFNDLNGVPASTNSYLLKTILREELGFKGVVVSDWASITETVIHGMAADDKEAAALSANAGLDMEMVSTSYTDYLPQLIASGKISELQIDTMVKRVLALKKQLGLFSNVYTDPARQNIILSKEHLEDAKHTAIASMVLLKNNNKVLPLNTKQKVLLVGPMADAAHDQMGTWVFDGNKENSVTLRTTLENTFAGTNHLHYEKTLASTRSSDTKGFAKTIKATEKADVIIFVGGEEAALSGEAHSRSDIRLPGAQEALLHALKKTGKPLVLVIMAGRQIALQDVINDLDGILMAWHPGTMAGPAIADILMGKVSPSGRLPVTWPKATGQVPIYYNSTNTGRPGHILPFIPLDQIDDEASQNSLGNVSRYIDIGFEPQFPFGFGLTYSTFNYSDLSINKNIISQEGELILSALIKNTGGREATETVQLYTQDVAGSITRPIRELKNFQQIKLAAGEQKLVSFTLTAKDLSFYNQALKLATEPGKFRAWIAPHSAAGLMTEFEVQ